MLPAAVKTTIKHIVPATIHNSVQRKYWNLIIGIDKARDVIRFLCSDEIGVSYTTRLGIIKQYYVVSANVDCPHTPMEILSYVATILSLPKSISGCVVEAGCFKGGSGAKFSRAAKLADRELVLFDSFEGIPENTEEHALTSHGANFGRGSYKGGLDEVKANISKYGHIEVCRFIKGWFEDTLPGFRQSIAAVYLDVDLVSSTRTCLKYLYPLLQPGGVLYSQDGHLPLVCDLFDDDGFWENQVGVRKPAIEGLRVRKLIKIIKPMG